MAIRVGGPNSGHTVVDPLRGPIVFRQLPTSAILPNVHCVLPAGTYLLEELLLREIALADIDSSRLSIDPRAVLISEGLIDSERHAGLEARIGSTLSGTGAAVVSRCSRDGQTKFAEGSKRLKAFVRDTPPLLAKAIDSGKRVVVEGTQGFGLSVLHSPYYPFATSRDTTASGALSEAGLSPLVVDEVVLVIRAFPIRVAGNSGPLPHEATWEDLALQAGSEHPFREFTSVTGKLRRVAAFDPSIVRRAIQHNRPSTIVLNHLDYVDAKCNAGGPLTVRAAEFLQRVEAEIGQEIDLVGLDPRTLRATDAKSRTAIAYGT